MEFSNIEVIIDHALKNDQNLKVALAVGKAYDEIRIRIINQFIDKLIMNIITREDIGGWKIVNQFKLLEDKKLKTDAYVGFFIAKSSWEGIYHIGFQSQAKGLSSLIIGALPINKPRQGSAKGIKEKLDKAIRKGNDSEHWDYYINVDQMWADWNDVDTLFRLSSDAGKAVQYFSDLLALIGKHVEDIIDYKINETNQSETVSRTNLV